MARPFRGLTGECDWVALREIVQAGTAELTLLPEAYDGAAAGVAVQAVSVLPGLAPGLRREDGDVWLGLQVGQQTGDVSTDLARAIGFGLAAEPGESVSLPTVPAPAPRLQEVIDPAAAFEVRLRESFAFWFEGVDDPDGRLEATLEQLDASLQPAARLTSVEAAYWVSTGSKEHLRWVLPYDEESLLTALSRLHVAGLDRLVDESRLVGSFRAHGLLVPVWDLPLGTGADALETPASEWLARLGEALSDESPLSEAERSARNGLANRQITVR